MKKAILCLDFDGVLHSYTSGWKGPETIPDLPVPGAIEFLKSAVEHFDVHVFSSRSSWNSGIDAMRDWLALHGAPVEALIFPKEKPPAFLTIDDRAWQFEGVWPSIEEIKRFKPWNVKTAGVGSLSPVDLPGVQGVTRLHDTDLMVGVAFERRLTDNELRDLHDYLHEKYNFDWNALSALLRA